jgi:hypothetical protein
VSKFFGFLLGIAVALAGPAVFGVLAADGGIELSAKEMALAYGIGALVFWTVISYFSGAGALGAALTFGAMTYAVYWIPNRMTSFLNDVPGLTTGMIEGIKEYTSNGVVPVLAVISLIYAIQLMIGAVQRRRLRAENDLLQRERDQAGRQGDDTTAQYPLIGGDYPTSVDDRYDDPYGEDLFPFPSRHSSDDEQTAQLPVDDQADRPGEQEPTDDSRTSSFAADPGTNDAGNTHQTDERYRERMDNPALDLDETAQHHGATKKPAQAFGFPAQPAGA